MGPCAVARKGTWRRERTVATDTDLNGSATGMPALERVYVAFTRFGAPHHRFVLSYRLFSRGGSRRHCTTERLIGRTGTRETTLHAPCQRRAARNSVTSGPGRTDSVRMRRTSSETPGQNANRAHTRPMSRASTLCARDLASSVLAWVALLGERMSGPIRPQSEREPEQGRTSSPTRGEVWSTHARSRKSSRCVCESRRIRRQRAHWRDRDRTRAQPDLQSRHRVHGRSIRWRLRPARAWRGRTQR